MAKLKQKEWMTITDCARHLSGISENGPISETDILQFAMDREIILSMKTTRQSTCPIWSASLISVDDISEAELDDFRLDKELNSANPNQRSVLTSAIDGEFYYGRNLHRETLIPAVWDIVPFASGEKFYTLLWNFFQQSEPNSSSLLTTEEPHLCDLLRKQERIELVDRHRAVIYSLPTHLIPPDSYIVIRKEQMHRLFEDEPKSAPHPELPTKERNTLYRMILGMALGKYGYDPETSRNKATGENKGSICADLQKAGLPVDSDTIRDHLKTAIQTIRHNQS